MIRLAGNVRKGADSEDLLPGLASVSRILPTGAPQPSLSCQFSVVSCQFRGGQKQKATIRVRPGRAVLATGFRLPGHALETLDPGVMLRGRHSC